MGRSLNIVAVSGNLTRDPELRATQGGLAICTLSIAVNGSEKVNGEWRDRPDYFDVTVFGAQAENAGNWLHKGSHVEISGRLRQDRWEGDDGKTRSAVKIVADAIVFPPKNSTSDASPQTFAERAVQQFADAGIPVRQVDQVDEDIPF